MVDHSELPFRVLCRRYGATLAYTPMIHAAQFNQSSKTRKRAFDPSPDGADRPLVAQFAGCDAATIIAAAKHVEASVDAVDLNFGCPQKIACRGGYGSFLLERDWDWLVGMVAQVARGLNVPLTLKLRLVMGPDGTASIERTVELCRRLEQAGVSLITLHGRTRLEIKREQRQADWAAIGAVRRALGIPIIANGGVYTLADARACIEATGADGVMSAEGLLEDPALFSGLSVPRENIAQEYLELARQYPPFSLRPVRGHLFKLLHAEATTHTLLARKMQTARNFEEIVAATNVLISARVARRGAGADARDPIHLAWYFRHRVHIARAEAAAGAPAGDALEGPYESFLAQSANCPVPLALVVRASSADAGAGPAPCEGEEPLPPDNRRGEKGPPHSPPPARWLPTRASRQ